MSDGNFNRSLLPHTPFQSGLQAGRSQGRMHAINAFKECKKKLDEGRYKAKVVDPWTMLKSGKVEF